MHHRLFRLWDRLVESGIIFHVERMNIAFYKELRGETIRRFNRARAERWRSDGEHNAEDGTVIGSELMLFLLVLAIGHGMACVVFATELVTNWITRRDGARVVPFGENSW